MMLMSFSNDPIPPVILRTLAGTASSADEAELRQWLAADPVHPLALDELRLIWQEAGKLQQGWETSALQQRILGSLDAKRPGTTLGTVTLLRGERRWSWVPAIAAAVVLMLAGGLAWYAAANRAGYAAVADAPLTELVTRRGQRAVLTLSDGTRIVLGVDSRLRYPATFRPAATRDVYLDGEAYFEVAHDTLRPFRVHAGEAVTRVLGTRFGVRAYPDDRAVRVVVAEGKVALGRATPDAILSRGDLGELKPGAAAVVRRGVDVESHLAWMHGRLVFADTPLREVVQRLSRWYDLDVELGDPTLADNVYTTSLRGDEEPEQVLRVVAAAVGAQLEQRGTTYVLVRKTRGTSPKLEVH